MQRSAVVVVADKTSLKRPFIFANAVHMVGKNPLLLNAIQAIGI